MLRARSCHRGSAVIPSPPKPGRPSVPAIDRKDLGLLGLLPALALLAALTPERPGRFSPIVWRACASRCAAPVRRTRSPGWRRLVGARPLGLAPAPCWRAHLANNYLAWMVLLRCWASRRLAARRRGSRARRRSRPLSRSGQGGILWVAPFAFSDLVTKLALHEAGYAVAHLSRDTHGFSTTRFGRRVLNPIQTRVERRYLAERLVMSDERSVGPLRELAARLEQNRLVSITLAASGRRTRLVPLPRRLPSGSRPARLALACQTGAPLLPVFTLREPDGRFVDPDRGGAPRRSGAGARCRDRRACSPTYAGPARGATSCAAPTSSRCPTSRPRRERQLRAPAPQ